MSNKKKYLIVLLLLTVLLTGCTKVMKDGKEIIKNPDTGQALTENILCKPVSKKTQNIYIEHKVKIDKLADCKNLKINSGGYEGLWTSGFVKPLAWLIVQVGNLLKNYGLAVIIITLAIRMIMYPITRNTAMQSENMKKIKPLMDKIEKKYNGKEQDRQAMMMKSQEMMAIYKENNIKPFAGCLFSIIQIPLFFAFYEALMRLPIILEGNLGPFKLGLTPGVAIQNGQWWYFIIVILVVLVTFFSFKMSTGASMSEEQAQQMKLMSNIFVVIIAVTSFTIAMSIALYWITSSGFTIIQNLLVKRGKKHA